MYRLCLLFISLSGSAFGQANGHLEPDDSVFTYGWSLDYYSNVVRVLGRVLPERSPKVFVLPSNLNEYVIGINDEEGGCLIVSGRVTHTLWLYESRKDNSDIDEYMKNSDFPEDPLDVAVDLSDQPASPDFCRRVRDVWATTLLRTRYPDPDSVRVGADGVSFHFSTWQRGRGILSGKTWSPEGQTIPGKLVALSMSLRSYSRSGIGDDLEALDEALTEIESALQ